jgi:hypothetical protein
VEYIIRVDNRRYAPKSCASAGMMIQISVAIGAAGALRAQSWLCRRIVAGISAATRNPLDGAYSKQLYINSLRIVCRCRSDIDLSSRQLLFHRVFQTKVTMGR